MTVQHTPGQDAGTPTPGADPNGYMLGPDGGAHVYFVGGLMSFKAKAADTRGVLSFMHVDVPHGWQAPVDRHAHESELFHITHGEWEIYVNDTVHLATPGCTLWIPANTDHSIFVRSTVARGYCVIAPGGFEKFFEDLGEPAAVPSRPTHDTRMPSVDELLAGGASYGWQLIDPQPRRLG